MFSTYFVFLMFFSCENSIVEKRHLQFYNSAGKYKVVKIQRSNSGRIKIDLIINDVEEVVIHYKLEEIYNVDELIKLKEKDLLFKEKGSFELSLKRDDKFVKKIKSKLEN